MSDYIHGVRADIVLEQRRLDSEREDALRRIAAGSGSYATEAREELERLRHLDPDRESYGGSRDEMVTTPLVRPEPVAPAALDADVAKYLVSMTFTSRHDNATPHIVTRHFDGSVTCICQAHAPCWGIKAYRTVTGVQ